MTADPAQKIGVRWSLTATVFILMIALSVLAACNGQTPGDTPLPTLMNDLDAAATAQVMTQNAPPPRFRERISLPELESGLDLLDGWHYTVTAQFEGVFTGTSRPATGITTAQVVFHQLSSARRILLTAEGSLFNDGQAVSTEAVRIGRDTYLISGGQCTVATGTATADVVDVGVNQLIGGITEAVPVGVTGIINGENVYGYTFSPDALRLASIVPKDGGTIQMLNADLWFSAERAAVVRLYITLDIENASVFGSQLPVSGQVTLRYDLTNVGEDPNISVPFGC